MSPEAQDKIIKVGGAILLIVVIIAAAKLLKGETELIASIVAIAGTAFGVLGFNSPFKGVRAANGLVSVRAPSSSDVEKMKQVVQTHESMNPPAGDAS